MGLRYHFISIDFYKDNGQMNNKDKKEKDIKLWKNIVNHLVYLTTRDEYGTIRSRNIETMGQLAEEVNNEGIFSQKNKPWSENSIKLFLPRIMNRYPDYDFFDECDFDFIGRHNWEYQSYSKKEEVLDPPIHKKRKEDYSYQKSTPVYSYNFSCNEKWKEHEIEDLIKEEKKVLIEAKKSKKRTRISKK